MHPLDAQDPLAHCPELFVRTPEVRSYLDGNSLGRPLRASVQRLTQFAEEEWGGRLIRGWEEGWLELPLQVGDALGAAVLGAAPGQAAVADSTTVLLYKLARAAIAMQAEGARDEIVVHADDFPTDRYVLEGIAAETGSTLRWITTVPERGVGTEDLASVLGERTALVLLSHVAYRSGFLADAATVTAQAHAAGALVLWDASHAVGSVPLELDSWGADLAVGCSYKYLNGGPGAPAWAYVASRHQEALAQPVQGWMGVADMFEMAPGYRPAAGMRRVLSGTPPITGMIAMQDMIALIAETGMPAVRAKSEAMTAYALELIDEWLVPLGVRVATPRDPAERGSHVTIAHESFSALVPRLQEAGVIPDFRRPDGIRIGLSPLSTTFAELELGLAEIRDALR
ncbi:kynureninase [Rathayibacter tanaceti]|uniref:Kynureninase n=2 Tax=Rathayibacter tanaceti TaxID=1671680 RepID=A0A166ICD5_9MICO|nr:aminotransferase class V-fold PLP-dependent enzyme [Rathayibacter tanaceti]KZX22144.1 Kynureninase [Rathayibacter tanaceti]QHC54471.1 aminotransferase class V-fold PLP-dependent enzyme [Rathayibacter tanaceti]TCO35040.1 kynureninase [Rathayibacter tanaceti]